MAAADEFARISAVLSEVVPADADIRSIELRHDHGGRQIVTVHTRTPARLIGRHGAMAGTLRAVMAERIGDGQLQLNISSVPDDRPPDERPPDGPGVMYPPACPGVDGA